MFVTLKGYCHTTTSTFFPATVEHKACLRSCHRKRPISREQIPFLFSKTIPMACRAVSCSLGSFHHLKHLAALQHAAAARWEPTVPLLSWATQSWAIPLISLATRKKSISSLYWPGWDISLVCTAPTEPTAAIGSLIVAYSILVVTCLCPSSSAV